MTEYSLASEVNRIKRLFQFLYGEKVDVRDGEKYQRESYQSDLIIPQPILVSAVA